MDLEKRAMVIGSGVLFPGDSDFFNGFKSIVDCDYRDIISRECKFESKIGPDDKRIFSYIVFLNPKSGEVYAFLRGEDQAETSICISGPILQCDASRETRFKYILKNGALREANKQVKVNASLDDCHGFINLEIKNYTDRFGLLYFALTDSKEVRTQSRRTRVIPIRFEGKKNLPELERLSAENQLDECSKAIMGPLKGYLNFI